MSRRFQFSLGWGLFGTGFGAALGAAICWGVGADQTYWLRAGLGLAFLFGVLGSFFGDEIVTLIFEVLAHLIP
ncbi:MAG TPA: hypothetical protein VG125_30995 [Pirellulales bacterium]|jgi:hypothetical protein|nr:hypothetical protein [Pirellulales bacterium]